MLDATIGLSVIIPANNEERFLGACLAGLEQQVLSPADVGGAEIIVAANACRDRTVAVAEACRPDLEQAGWALQVLDIPEAGKLNALNRAEAVMRGRVIVYLDADVVCSPPLMTQLVEVLSSPTPLYASGRLQVAPAKSWSTRHYARIWQRLPFMTETVPGAGLFAVNRAGRSRWGTFPDIISDDGFVRLHFKAEERVMVDASYTWPLVEGARSLVKVRRRQDTGVRQIEALYPELAQNESKPPVSPRDHLRLFVGHPLSYLVYVAIIASVRLGSKPQNDWSRGR